MKRFLLLVFFFSSLAASGSDDPQSVNPRVFKLPKGLSAKDYLPNTLIVKFRKGVSTGDIRSATSSFGLNSLKLKSAVIQQVNQVFKDALLSKSGQLLSTLKTTDSIGLDRVYEFNFNSDKTIVEVINEVLANGMVEYAEPSYIYHTAFIPNDPFYTGYQSFLKQIKAEQSWDLIRNSSNTVIAIVDSGSDMDHIDLKANILLPGKDLVGASFSTLLEDDDPDVKSDSTDHGVRVSGMASAVSNNGIGIASVASNAKLLIVKAGADNNGSTIYRGYEGIKYAADNGAHIINCSWGGPGGGSYGQDVVNYALSKGCLIIVAAGNSNTSVPEYPANYPGIMSVAAVDMNDRKSSFSNYGSHVSIAAPGEVFTTTNGNKYDVARGTSLAAPMVASAAALVRSRFPLFDMVQVKEQLMVTSDNLDAANPAFSGSLGKGRLNVFRALTEAVPAIRYQNITILDKGKGSRPSGDTLRIFLDLKNILSPATGVIAKLSSANPNIQIIDQEVLIGNMATMQLKTMMGPFRVYIKPGISENALVDFIVSYSSGGSYAENEKFQIRVALDYLNIEVNQVSTTISSNGRIGYSDPDSRNGLGFIYKGDPLLFEASLMIGTSAVNVSNNTRNDKGGADEHFIKKKIVYKDPDPLAAFLSRSEFDDSGNPARLNLYVRHSIRAFSAAPDDKYVLAEYEIENTGKTVLNDIYAGLFTDWDVDPYGTDITKYDVINRLGYVYGKYGNTPYAGVKLLSPIGQPLYYPMSAQVLGDPLQTGNGFSVAEKYQTLSSGIKATSLGENSSNGYDVMFVSGYGPYTIPVNGSVKVAFALLAGDNLTDIQASAISAQKKYEEQNNSMAEILEDGFVLEQNYPNPAADQSTIEFGIDKAGLVSLLLYNSIGQPVKELLNGSLQKGSYGVNVELTDLDPGIYFYKMLFDGKEKTLKMIISK
ncbi:Por secretion system C-terminal sorting domain-containing protein [Daejeonella rubra]|uniref:Por secretion system C-terminal sorting domain-containing protein n=1 Tax=Daejeonella rubra TaxID=990371 RepID=A0A1G9T9I0_9SPHI|nr:S8 family serine peptidase [Daejeonella rubra]SDM44278.1 Por secretion system C-terminal sorting domain-containing protein [Daejeonella rubra]